MNKGLSYMEAYRLGSHPKRDLLLITLGNGVLLID